jgi:hypothetical protein
LLTRHLVLAIPHLWLVAIAAVLAKGVAIGLLGLPSQRRVYWLKILAIATLSYGILSLQLYVMTLLWIPWFLPSALFWSYLFPFIKWKANE